MMVLRDTVAGPWQTTMASHKEPQRQRYSGPILINLAFNWDAQDRYIELKNFELEVLNILETKL